MFVLDYEICTSSSRRVVGRGKKKRGEKIVLNAAAASRSVHSATMIFVSDPRTI